MRYAFAVLALATLAGCASEHPSPMFCPNVRVLAQAQTLNDYLPGRNDVAAELTSATVTGVAGSCTLHPEKHLLVVSFQAGFAATNGPADNGAPLNLPWFVAIAQGDDIISKSLYTIPLTFDGNQLSTSAISKPVKVEIPNDRLTARTDILVGFQLTPQQLSVASGQPSDANP